MEAFLKKLILEAGKMAMETFRKPHDVQQKGRQDVVTETDFKIDQFFHREIGKKFPDDAVYSEEGDHADLFANKRTWVVDPIDGTSNFMIGIPTFCISVGIVRNGFVELGAIYDPFSKELFWAERGQGATLNGEKIRVADTERLADAVVVAGRAHHEGMAVYKFIERLSDKTLKIKKLGSAAIALAYTACGRLDSWVGTGEIPLWDVAAGSLIVQEAGGLVTRCDGTPWRPEKGSMVATNTRIHNELLKYTS